MLNYYYIQEVGKSQYTCSFPLDWQWLICKSCSNLRLMYTLVCFQDFEDCFQNLYSWYIVFLMAFLDKLNYKLMQMAISIKLMDFNFKHLLFILVLMLTKVFSEIPWLIKISKYLYLILYMQMIWSKIKINNFILNFNKIILFWSCIKEFYNEFV